MEEIIQKIIRQKLSCYFVSPHLDDAILSAGSLIQYLAKHTKVTVVSIFTKASPPPYTLAAKRFLHHCGYTNADLLFKDRQKEDNIACTKAGAYTNHLGFIDGSFRKKMHISLLTRTVSRIIPEVGYLYPFGFKLFNLSREDRVLCNEVKKQLLDLTNHDKNYVVFGPLGSVKHMDHTLTHDICLETFKNTIFWADYPYNLHSGETKKIQNKLQLQSYLWGKNLLEKQALIKLYKTQLSSLPRTVLHVKPEVYYYKSS